jgi:hypothetical protein
MKDRNKVITPIVGLIFCAGVACGQTTTQGVVNGYWWRESTRLGRLNYIQGYYDGMTRILVKASPECADACPGILPHIPDVTYGQVADGLDHFYSDYRYKTVPIPMAITYVWKELDGASPEDLEKYRRNMLSLISKKPL